MTLEEKLNAAIARQRNILASVKSAGQETMNEEQQAQFDEAQREIDDLRGQIAQERGVQAERTRISGINDLCRSFGLDPNPYIEKGNTLEETRGLVLEELKKHGGPGNVRVTDTGEDQFRRDASDAMQLRCGHAVEKVSDGARSMRSMSLRDLAVECLRREGEDTSKLLRMSSSELFDQLQRAYFNPEAAFPAILDQTIRKNIVQIYQTVPTTFELWTTRGSVTDFKPTKDRSYVMGGGRFYEVPENGELKASRPETQLLPTRQIKTYGTSFSMSRQAFIDDDIGFLSEVPGQYAATAKREINRQCYAVLYENPVIFDGKALFCEEHGNLAPTGAAPTVKSLQGMLKRMALQTNQFGERINVTPRRIISPVGYEMELYRLLKSAGLPGTDYNDVNPLAQYGLNVITEATLNGMAGENACPWFMAAETSSAKGIQVDYLNGVDTPTIRRMETPGQLGYVWDIYMDWGVSVVDFRGLSKNPGEVLTIDD